MMAGVCAFAAVSRSSGSGRPFWEVKGHDISRREVAETLQLLARVNGWLACERLSTGDIWRLFAPHGRGGRVLGELSPALVAMLRREQLVEAEDAHGVARLRLSPKGRRWLKRQGLHAPEAAVKASPAAGGAQKTKKHKAGANRGNDGKRDIQRLLIRDAETGALREVEVNVRENPLMWLARRKDAAGRAYLEPHHVAAGERLRREYETACMQPNITSSWNAALAASDRRRLKGGPRDPFPFAERVLAARERVHAALAAIGPELADVVVAVCCLGHGIEAAERALNWPRRSARLVLKIALERLADFYGLKPANGRGTPRWRQALGWHAPDGRPSQLMPSQQEEGASHNG